MSNNMVKVLGYGLAMTLIFFGTALGNGWLTGFGCGLGLGLMFAQYMTTLSTETEPNRSGDAPRILRVTPAGEIHYDPSDVYSRYLENKPESRSLSTPPS